MAKKSRKFAAMLLSLAMIGMLAGCSSAGENPPPADQTTPETNQQGEVSNDNNQQPEESNQQGEASNDANQQPEESSGKQVGSGDVGEHHVEIKGASLAEDYEGKPVIIVTYTWTNNSEETISAMSSLMEKAFQDGVQLENAIITNADNYESGTSMKDIRPGTTLDIQQAYVLGNTTSKVEFEVSEFLGFSDEMVTMDFDPANLG